MRPKLSIIIPVYNVEPYLDDCLQSILRQTFNDWECLLVNDGSTDKSGEICDRYASEDSRFRVFHKQNGGQSTARNLALDNAKGELVTFLDSDDEWEDGVMINELVESFDNDRDLEVIQYPFWQYLPGQQIQPVRTYNRFNVISTNHRILLEFQEGGISTIACDKMFRTSIIADTRFPEGMYFEDECFVIDVLKKVSHFAFSPTGKYKYRLREGSTTHPEIFNLRLTMDLFKKDFHGVKFSIHYPKLLKLYKRYFNSSIKEYKNAQLLSATPVLQEYHSSIRKLSPSWKTLLKDNAVFTPADKIFISLIKAFGFRPLDYYLRYRKHKH